MQSIDSNDSYVTTFRFLFLSPRNILRVSLPLNLYVLYTRSHTDNPGLVTTITRTGSPMQTNSSWRRRSTGKSETISTPRSSSSSSRNKSLPSRSKAFPSVADYHRWRMYHARQHQPVPAAAGDGGHGEGMSPLTLARQQTSIAITIKRAEADQPRKEATAVFLSPLAPTVTPPSLPVAPPAG